MDLPRVVFLLISACLSAGTMLLAMQLSLGPWRRSAGQHWTERARLLASARQANGSIIIGFLVTAVVAWKHWFPGGNPAAAVMAVLVGLMLGGYPSVREYLPRTTFWPWLRRVTVTLATTLGMFGPVIWLMITMPKTMDAEAWTWACAGIAWVLIVQTGIWIPLSEKLFPSCKNHPGRPRLERAVQAATAVSGVKPRHVWLDDSPLANAMALFYVRAVLATTRLMEVLNDEELHIVLLHEMAHLRESRAVRALRLLGTAPWLLMIFINPIIHQWRGFGVLGLMLVLMGVQRIVRKLSVRMEEQADRASVADSTDPKVYARALEKIYEANQTPAVLRGKVHTHPHLYDRLLQAGLEPDYPRPAPPPLMAWPGWIGMAVPAGYVAWVLVERFA